jgi:biotin-(acetyl-CoA carboxylase) ligase
MALETGSAFDVGDVLGDLAAALEDALGRLARGGTRWLRAAWRRRDALAGATVGLTAAEGPVEGAYAGVAADGRLRLRDSHGRLHLFWSGDVALLRRRRIF